MHHNNAFVKKTKKGKVLKVEAGMCRCPCSAMLWTQCPWHVQAPRLGCRPLLSCSS